jgi:hypothetical protein
MVVEPGSPPVAVVDDRLPRPVEPRGRRELAVLGAAIGAVVAGEVSGERQRDHGREKPDKERVETAARPARATAALRSVLGRDDAPPPVDGHQNLK